MFPRTIQQWRILVLILSCIGLTSLAIAATMAAMKFSFVKKAICAKGEIVNFIERKSEEGNNLYAPVYIFTDQTGNTHKIVSSVSSSPPIGEVGDSIDLLYDPEDPENAEIDSFSSLWLLPIAFGIMGVLETSLFVGIALILTYMIRRGKNANQTIQPTPLRGATDG